MTVDQTGTGESDQASGLREMLASGTPGGAPLRVIAVCSGKGGVGKTHVSANLAVLAAKRGLRVLIVDADLGLANVEILFGIKPRYHLGHLLEGTVPVEQIIAQGPHGICVLPSGSGVQKLTRLDDAQKLRMVTALDPLEDRFDLVMIDNGAGIGENVMFFTGAAQEALLILTPEPTSFTDAYATVKVLCQNASVRHFNVVVNQVPGEGPARDLYAKLTQVTERFLSAQMRYLGYLPRDENVHRAAMAQRPLVDLYPSSPSARALAVVASRIFDEPAPAVLDGGMKFLWQRLFRETPAPR
jgi:flagellar biosynthesis protein FlhG